jgi:acetyl-CoA carboxylase carboxyl transferase beta subunit
MIEKSLFKKPNIALEGRPSRKKNTNLPEELCANCEQCAKMVFISELAENCYVCPACAHHFRMGARRRIALIADEGTFVEHDADLSSENVLDFPDYEEKISQAEENSGEKEAVITGVCSVGGCACGLFVMEGRFMMGSMGRVVGEKLSRLFEYAAQNELPVVGFTVSGGARMQEGILSLMQMAKVSGAVGKHGKQGLFYLTILTHPTTGGVTASFAMEGDIILAEPNALVGFAGPRVIEQTIRKKLPPGFQRAEFLLKKGFVDAIVDRREQKDMIAALLRMHERGGAHESV